MLCLAAVVVALPLQAQRAAADSVELLATTQRLFDAITTGDSTVWAKSLARDWFVTDEEGNHIERGQFLRELRGLPPGQRGRLEVKEAHVRRAPGVVILSYDVHEWHDYYGQARQDGQPHRSGSR